jgi:hypothetical protein
MPIPDKKSGFRTKDADFEQKVRIPYESSGFRTKDADFEQKMPISNKRS